MLGNAIKQTTATTGTGNLTLSAVTGYPKLSDEFAVGQLFSYSLLDSSGLFKESGLGYLSSSTVMVRAKVSATFTSSTYNNISPSALSLTGTTTVICTPLASSTESIISTIDNVSSSVNRFITSAHKGLVTATQVAAALRCYYVPVLLKVGAPLAGLSLNVTTAGASGAQALMGIYTCNENGYIGNKLADGGPINVDVTGTVNATLASPIFLPPGWYYTALVTSANCSVNCYTSSLANQIGGSPLGFSGIVQIEYRFETLASFALPSSANVSTSAQNVGSSHSPLIYMRVA